MIDNELKFPRALIERNVRYDRHVEGDIAEPFLRQYRGKPRGHGRDGGAAFRIVELGFHADGKAKRSGPGNLHLKARHPFDEDLIDRMRADEILIARSIDEQRHSFGAADEALDEDPGALGALIGRKISDMR